MTRPKLRIDATGLASIDRRWQDPVPLHARWTPAPREMKVRARLGRLFAFYEAGAASEQSDPLFRKGCARVLEELSPYKAHWEAVTGRGWILFNQKTFPRGGPETGPMRQSIGGDAAAGMPTFPELWSMPEVARAERGRQQVLDAAQRAEQARNQRRREEAEAARRQQWHGWQEAAQDAHKRAAGAGRERTR